MPFQKTISHSFRLAYIQGITVYCTWYIFVGLSARMRLWNIMSCDIQQVGLNDLMVSLEYTKWWGACQKPGRLLVFLQVYMDHLLLHSMVKLPFASFRAGYWGRKLMLKWKVQPVLLGTCGKCWTGETQLRLNRSKILLKLESWL